MSEERVILRSGEDGTTEAVAELVRYRPAARRWRAAAFIGGGLLLGFSCSIVPGPHMLVTVWLLPLAGIWLGMRALRTEVKLVHLTGPCPACGKPLELFGGSIDGARECRRCRSSIELALPEPT